MRSTHQSQLLYTYLCMRGKASIQGGFPIFGNCSHQPVLDLDLKLMNHLLWRRLNHWAQRTCYLPQSLHN